VDADWRIVGVDALITFPLSPLTTLRVIAYKKTTDRAAAAAVVVWGSSRWIKVERDLDPDVARTRNLRIWRLGGVKLEPPQLELLGVLGGGSGAVRTPLWKRRKHRGALYA